MLIIQSGAIDEAYDLDLPVCSALLVTHANLGTRSQAGARRAIAGKALRVKASEPQSRVPGYKEAALCRQTLLACFYSK